MSHARVLVGAVALALSLGACAGEDPIIEASRECADVYGGQVCTWTQTQGDLVVAAGADIPMATIVGAPDDVPMAWPPATAAVLPFPASSQTSTGMAGLTMYWEAHGHPPGPYLTPHWDFHFYRISDADRLAIDCSDVTKPASLAEGYALPDQALSPEEAGMLGVEALIGLCVPAMGMHALPAAELESTELFRGTMIVGYYHGQPIFVEPMITKAMLMERASFDMAIPTIPGLTGAHPTVFRAEYDADNEFYRFAFSGFAGGE
jgi:hypothetical protein